MADYHYIDEFGYEKCKIYGECLSGEYFVCVGCDGSYEEEELPTNKVVKREVIIEKKESEKNVSGVKNTGGLHSRKAECITPIQLSDDSKDSFWDSIDVSELSPTQRKHFKAIMRKEVRVFKSTANCIICGVQLWGSEDFERNRCWECQRKEVRK